MGCRETTWLDGTAVRLPWDAMGLPWLHVAILRLAWTAMGRNGPAFRRPLDCH